MPLSAVLWPSNRSGIVIGSDFLCAFPFPITELLQSGAEASMISKSTCFGSSEKISMTSYLILKVILPLLVVTNYLIRKV